MTLLSVVFTLNIPSLLADENACYRVYLKDKGSAAYMETSAEDYLSPEAVERRMLREAYPDASDLPVSQQYIDAITSIGCRYVVQSRWMKTVVVECVDSISVGQLALLPFVDSIKCVRTATAMEAPRPCTDDTSRLAPNDTLLESPYGYALEQITMLNGVKLHEAGYRGKGMKIAVVDAGFANADRIEAFASMRLLGTHNVATPDRSVFCEDNHGTKALSCLAANLPGIMTGTAPEASYLLIKSEQSESESPVEEDFWAAAVEYADSFGVDIISSSLGYFRYDSFPDYYTNEDLNGYSAFISKVAAKAAEKGLLVVTSAGNEGNKEWSKIVFPADVENILSVGSINDDGTRSGFSSIGMTADYRIKPDVTALGSGVCLFDADGDIRYSAGTSFSAPAVAGMAACLWQALPLLKNTELMQLIRNTADRNDRPDVECGYGIPDFYKAYQSKK
ncbi:MAG: S8 family serine peptidase [Tannerella sp.]|jgi:subtilisin family serine protease|nr:S8 family serine peptidase [Tannerella sp.]